MFETRIKATEAQLRLEALIKLNHALALIERAENELNSACSELSALDGGVPAWRACHALAAKVHSFWYRVNSFKHRGKFSLDSINVESLERRLGEKDKADAIENARQAHESLKAHIIAGAQP